MTVTKVLGYGLQKAIPNITAVTEVSVHLLPKVQSRTCCFGLFLWLRWWQLAKKVLYTGKYGDGKFYL